MFCTCKSCKLRQNQYEQLASSLFVRPEDLLDIRLRCFKLSYALLTPSVYAPVPHPCIHPSGFLFQPCYDSPGGPGPGLYPVTSPVSDTPCHGRAASLSPRPPFTPTVKIAGARFPTVHTQRAASRGAGPLTLSRTHEDHAPLQHGPSSPPDGTGPRASLPDGKPEAPVNRSYKSSGSSRQVQRRTSLDCSNLAVRPSADRPDRCGRRMGHLVPYAGLPYASPLPPPGLRTYHTALPAPHYRTAPGRGGPGRQGSPPALRGRAGHLVLDTASLAIHTASDASPGRSRAPWTARSAKAQAPRAKPTVL